MTELVYDRNYARDGLSPSHQAILGLVPSGTRVLDVGCASGYLAAELQASKGCTVTGVEYDQGAVELARSRGIDAHQIDLEQDRLDAEGFDVVIFGDVLEHLRDPDAVLRQAHPAATVIVSLPNIGHWTARLAHLRGEWRETDDGLFDRTHLHQFTRRNAHALAERTGFTVTAERFTADNLPLQTVIPPLWHLRQRAANRWPELFAFQLVLALRPRR